MRTPLPWSQTLDSAGIVDPLLRRDYTWCAHYSRRRDLPLHLALRIITPARIQPQVLAGAAFFGYTDDLAERPPTRFSRARLDDWVASTARSIESGKSSHPLIRAYLHAAATRRLSHDWPLGLLRSTESEFDFRGFADDQAISDYVESYTLPGGMCCVGMLYEGGPEKDSLRFWRHFAQFTQRVDFLADLSSDMQNGRLNLAYDSLQRHGVTWQDLWEQRDTPGIRKMLEETYDRASEAGELARASLESERRGIRFGLGIILDLLGHMLEDAHCGFSSVLKKPIAFPVLALPRAVVSSGRNVGFPGLRIGNFLRGSSLELRHEFNARSRSQL
ncbi:phytoene/squalene synthase family protein [Amycolatopsis alba]|uniref:Phytoene synthase n=1 Tax=Amycolatopsis alba DSM 44262 TaxID=1125972 RepID=A0A229RLE6_AMYAL|nr:squalene/phytoene synthase family protein [Amycolatopsis alba]OXM47385.1 hypothetical protein CFP75_24425 [Amycolatopsis alba DSM 44262]